MNLTRFFLFAIVVWYCSAPEGRCQDAAANSILADSARRAQLLNAFDANVSFMVRPYSATSARQVRDTAGERSATLRMLPFKLRQRYNSALPYGWNDGPMIPVPGYQAYANAGLEWRRKWLHIQLAPEVVIAQNRRYEEFPASYSISEKSMYASYFTNDLPPYFGDGMYRKIYAGQSFLRVESGALSAGVSTENMWWGPGIRNSLLMSNTAPGYPHVTVNTRRPAKAFFGTYEFQVTGGKLTTSGFNPPGFAFVNKNTLGPDSTRYISGLVVSVHPRWVPGLHVGFARSFLSYFAAMHSVGSYVPFVLPIFKNENHENAKSRDQLASIFARWVWAPAKVEVYGELAHEDHNVNVRDFVLEPEHSRAYTAGLRKLLPVGRRGNDLLQITLETTHLEQASLRNVRQEGPWYGHYLIRAGYTNEGQLLGAGIGSGNNLLSADISWFRGINHIGIQAEKNVRYADQYYMILNATDSGREWADYSAAAIAQWRLGKVVIDGKFQYIRSVNYWWQKGTGKTNVHSELGFQYDF